MKNTIAQQIKSEFEKSNNDYELLVELAEKQCKSDKIDQDWENEITRYTFSDESVLIWACNDVIAQ